MLKEVVRMQSVLGWVSSKWQYVNFYSWAEEKTCLLNDVDDEHEDNPRPIDTELEPCFYRYLVACAGYSICQLY